VASDVGDVSRVVADGATGYVVPAKSPDELASALRKLLVDAGLRRQLGRAGRRRAEEHFSDVATARAISDLYASVLEARR
jgi:glycosyltransferase involved in cell wall biosynthesis